MKQDPNISELCAKVFPLFFHPGEVTEIRAYGLSGRNNGWEGWARGDSVVFGYFDDAERFGQAAYVLEAAKGPGIYFVLNPVNPDLLARAANRLKVADKKTPQTSDRDVVCLRWLYVDIDPIRPAGISSTEEEMAEAVRVRDAIVEDAQRMRNFVSGVKAISGNGAHVLFRLPDHANDAEGVAYIRETLHYLQHAYGNDKVDVDTKVYNPSRICKLYGTTARKGDHIFARPHRRSYIEAVVHPSDALEGKSRDPAPQAANGCEAMHMDS